MTSPRTKLFLYLLILAVAWPFAYKALRNYRANEAFAEAEAYVQQENWSKAYEAYRKAVTHDHEEAMHIMNWCYEVTNYASHYTATAREILKWYHKAEKQNLPEAQYDLAVCCEEGSDGIGQNWTEAVKWYRKAAEQGHARAQNNLSWCYANGKGVSQSWTEAVKWCRKAAEQGDSNALYNLGLFYKNGKGVSQSWTEAVKWYRKAAEQGHMWAQYNLGYSYANGRGVTQSRFEAIKWYRKAAEQGHESAQDILQRWGETW